MSDSAFRSALAQNRDVFNQKFAEARRRRPDLDAGAFSEFLKLQVAPVVEGAARVNPDRALEVAHAAYDAALTLVSERLAGAAGRHPALDALFERLLPRLAGLVADQPKRVIASLSNAVFNLASTPQARAGAFLESLENVAPLLPSVTDLLRAGELAAWRAGLAHLRASALAAGDLLPSQVASALLGAPKLEWHALRGRLSADPWWNPAEPEAPAPRLARIVGAFRGFGGTFLRPPRVVAVDGQLVAHAANECWAVHADAFGATLQRGDPALLGQASQPPYASPLALPSLGRVTSLAYVPKTIAVTGDASHQIALVAVS